MQEIVVKLNSVTDVNGFVDLASMCPGSVTVFSGRYIIDGKSLMGIYSIDLSNKIKVEFDGEIPQAVKEGIKQYIVE